jgi:hypothetical protein
VGQTFIAGQIFFGYNSTWIGSGVVEIISFWDDDVAISINGVIVSDQAHNPSDYNCPHGYDTVPHPDISLQTPFYKGSTLEVFCRDGWAIGWSCSPWVCVATYADGTTATFNGGSYQNGPTAADHYALVYPGGACHNPPLTALFADYYPNGIVTL